MVIKFIANGMNELEGSQVTSFIDNNEMWKLYFECMECTTGLIILVSHLVLLIVTYYFIINTKDFWDQIYFVKINHIYNTNCIFGEN